MKKNLKSLLTPKKTCSLYLIRHAQTDWNKQRRIQGKIDRPLSSAGKIQAKELAERLSFFSISSIISSPLKRATQTAEIIAHHLNCPFVIQEGLEEASHGSIDGLAISEYLNKFKQELQIHEQLGKKERLTNKIHPEAQSYHEIYLRFQKALLDISSHCLGKQVVIVSHAWTIKSLLIRLKNYDDRRLHIKNSALIQLQSDGNTLELIHTTGVNE